MKNALVVGCGYVGEVLADLCNAKGWNVEGWTASASSAERLRTEKAYLVSAHDISDPSNLRASFEPAVVVMCVSSGRGGGAEAYRRVYLEGIRHLLAAFPLARFVFTGSTSVYAQTDGSWVDETAAAEPSQDTGQILRAAEDLALTTGRGTVARLAGIYGPGRSTLLRKFLASEAMIEGDGGRWLNQIHRDDAAQALFHLATGLTSGIYNVSDGHPVTQLTLYQSMADQFRRPLPPSGPINLNRKRGWTSKRVNSQRLVDLGWKPAHASFLEWVREQSA